MACWEVAKVSEPWNAADPQPSGDAWLGPLTYSHRVGKTTISLNLKLLNPGAGLEKYELEGVYGMHREIW